MVNSIYVALSRSAYRPGDDIYGTVCLQVDDPIERASLTLTVDGVESTQWRKASAAAAGLDGSCLPPSNSTQQRNKDSIEVRTSIGSRHSRVFSRLGPQGQLPSSPASPQPSLPAGDGCRARVAFFQAQSVLLGPSSHQQCDIQPDNRHQGHSRPWQPHHHPQQLQRPQQQQQLLAPGRHALPFAVRLPRGAPPSLALQQGARDPVTGEPQPFSASIAYHATATLTRLPSITTASAISPASVTSTPVAPPPSPLTSSATFTVLPRLPAPTGCRPCVRDQVEVIQHHPGVWWLGLGLLGANGCCRTRTATLGVTVRLDKDGYAPGEDVVVDVQADAAGCRPALSRCRVSLRRHLVAHGAGGEVVRASSVLSAVRLAGATAAGRRNSWASSADSSVRAAAAAPAAAAATSVSATDRGFRVSLPIPPAIATPTLLGQLVRVYYAVDVHFEGSAFVCDPRIRVLCPVHPPEAATAGTVCPSFAAAAAATATAAAVTPIKLPADGVCRAAERGVAAEAVAVVAVMATSTGGHQTVDKRQKSGAYRSGAEEAAGKHGVPVQRAEQGTRKEQRPRNEQGQGRESLRKGRGEQRGSNSGLPDVLSAYSVSGRDQDH